MKTGIKVTFPIPYQALYILKIIHSQNEKVAFCIDENEGTLSICGDVLDFSEYADGWDEERIDAVMEESRFRNLFSEDE